MGANPISPRVAKIPLVPYPLSTQMADSVQFQHFEVLRNDDGSLFELGRGAMGITYKAFDTNLRCYVALKVINSAYLNSEVARQRFLREARAAAALRHPNVATVFHLGTEDDNYFYAMEFVDGQTVEAFMKREGPVPPAMALEIASQVSRALGAAQKQGLVHRDIKPSNLMFVHEDGSDSDFTVKVIDFGLAKNASVEGGGEDAATLTGGGFLGTPHFASPEQLEEREIDVRSDIYSLGVTLWYMLAGKTPFTGSLAQVMSQHLHREPPFQNLEGQCPPVVTLLRHMMAKDPADRPQTPATLRKEIEACIDAVQASATQAPAVTVAADSFETAVLPGPLQAEPATLASGSILAERFRLIDEVTASDHGRMFRAESIEDKTPVAVLILNPGLLTSSEAFTRLEGEVEALQKLKQPAFQQIHSLEHANHHTFLVLEWIDGLSLLELLRARRALSPAEARLILAPLAEAFDALKDAGLSCPDIAAHEVLLPGGEARQPVTGWSSVQLKFLPLTGAGASSLSPDATMVASSFAMMKASGAFAGNPATAYVYSVASLAYEMLGGVRAGSTTGSYVPIPGLSEEGNAALRRALNPAQGFPSARAFVDLLPVTGPAPTIAPPPVPIQVAAVPPPEFPTISPAKRSMPPSLLIACAVGLVLIVGFVVWHSLPAKPGKEVVAETTPTPTPIPVATPIPMVSATPEPAPTPDPARVAYDQALNAALILEKDDKPGPALEAFAELAANYPEEKVPLIEMEKIAAGIRRSSPKPTAVTLIPLREPLAKAAALDVVSAEVLLAEMLKKTDPENSLKWLLAAANHGQTEAMVQAGLMLSNGRGTVAADLPQAVSWFTKAADLGDPDGKYLLAECLMTGKGGTKDQKKAIELLTESAGMNNTFAMNMLGDIYHRGIRDLVPPNPTESFNFFTKAKELGSPDACGNLGVLYMTGQGVGPDEKKAADLFREGAELGSFFSMACYAQCLVDGRGVQKDFAAGREWFLKAALGGNPAALDWCKNNKIPLSKQP